MTNNKTSYNFIKYLRLFAAILVVNMHLIGTTFLSFPYYNFNKKECFEYLFDISHIAVPIFFMITGFIYFDKQKECTYKSLWHNFVKYAIFLLVVGSFYSYLLQLFPDKNINFDIIKIRLSTLKFNDFLLYAKNSVINVLENKRQFSHMWFLYSLLKIYLFLPILKAFFDKNSKNIYIVFLLMILSNYIWPYLNNIFNITLFNYFHLDYEFIYIVLGGMIALNYNKIKNSNFKLGAILIFVLINLLCIILKQKISNSYDNIIVLILSFLAFISFVSIDADNRIVNILQSNTFEVYLFHPLFLQILIRTFKLNVLNVAYLLYLVIIYLFIFAICYMMRKVVAVLFVRKK